MTNLKVDVTDLPKSKYSLNDMQNATLACHKYEELLAKYKHRGVKSLQPLSNPRAIAFWLRVYRAAEDLKVTVEVYIKAQFWCFHTWFKKAPQSKSLLSNSSKFNARKRVELYLESTQTSLDVFSPVLPAPQISKEKVQVFNDRRSEGQLLRFMTNYGLTEEQVLLKFATKERAYLFFDMNWLNTNKTYQELKSTGQL